MSLSRSNNSSRDDRSEEELWRDYKNDKDMSARDRLVDRYMSLVEKIVLRLRPNLPTKVQTDDLFSYGIIGLLDAIERFDVSAGVKFETFATWRIKGQILDFLRKEDLLPKGLRSKIKHMQDKLLEIEAREGIMHLSEAAERIGMEEEEMQQLINLSNTAFILSLDIQDDETDGSLKDVIADKRLDPSAILDRKLIAEEIRNLLDTLEGRDKKVLYMYYIECLTFKEIGQVLGLTEGRVSQVHSNILFFLRTALLKKGITCPSGQ